MLGNLPPKGLRIGDIAKRETIVIGMLARLAMPLVIMFGFYIQFHGEVSPGGGFQSGIVFAVAFILPDLLLAIEGSASSLVGRRFVPNSIARLFAASGVLIYAFTGLLCVFMGRSLFDYTAFAKNPKISGSIGLTIIEIGVSSTVFGAMTLIYNALVSQFLARHRRHTSDVGRPVR